MSNVLVLMSDEHNPGYASPYGHLFVQTPNMERLARAGVVFESAYCPSPLCMPSRSALMAGKRVHELQTYSNCNADVDPSPVSFGAALAAQGVHTAYIGKTDVYAPGAELGFSEMLLPQDRPWPGDTNHRRSPVTIREGAALRAQGYGAAPAAGTADVRCIDEAVRWLREVAPTLDRPWVLVVNVTNPHFPHIAQPSLWELYPEGGDLPTQGPEAASAQHPFAAALRDHFQTSDFAEADIRGLRRGYLACVTFVDRQLGRLLGALEAGGLRQETVVAYTSDHGEMLGKFGLWWKCSLYEDSVRIPLVVAGPGFPKGLRVVTPVDLHDLQATLFWATGVAAPSGWLGEPLQALLAPDPDRVVFSEYHGHGTPGSSYMIRKGRWKYLHHVGAPAQLFDLLHDPEELHDLADRESAVVAELAAHLENICSPAEEHARAEAFIEAQLETVARARADASVKPQAETFARAESEALIEAESETIAQAGEGG